MGRHCHRRLLLEARRRCPIAIAIEFDGIIAIFNRSWQSLTVKLSSLPEEKEPRSSKSAQPITSKLPS